MTRRAGLVLALIGAVALIAPTMSHAWRHPTNSEREQILYAGELHDATCSMIDLPCESFIRVSTKGPWAAEHVHPPKGHRAMWQAGMASFRKVDGRWRFHSISQDGQGCGAPRAVQLDLHIYCGNAP